MHRLRFKRIRASVIQLSLNPIVLFLLVKPGLRQRRSTKRAAASLQQVDHGQGVVALLALAMQPSPSTKPAA
jgi:hypothetical protein